MLNQEVTQTDVPGGIARRAGSLGNARALLRKQLMTRGCRSTVCAEGRSVWSKSRGRCFVA